MAKSEFKKISASRIKTLQNCSWLYWCQYVMKLPQLTNSGAQKGTVCHSIFELLLNPRHKKHYKAIVKANSLEGSPAVNRLVVKYLKIQKLTAPEEYDLVDEMILTGLKSSFFGKKGTKLFAPEFEFNMPNESPQYHINGFIDKWGVDEKNKTVYIYDYKSSKSKFSGEEHTANVQAMMYSLVAKKLYPEHQPVVIFVFLQYPDEPEQTVQFSDETLKGFEHYLESLNGQVNTFSYEDAVANFAYDKKQKGDTFSGPLLCGFCKNKGELKKDGKPKWACPYKFGFDYFAALNASGGLIKTSFTEEDLWDDHKIKNDIKVIEKRKYAGCPRFSKRDLTSF